MRKHICIINDNNLNYLGGERESQLIIINGIKNNYYVSVIQPGEFNDVIDGVNIYSLTSSLRMKHLIKNPIAFGFYIFRVGFLIKKIQPDIIHTQSQVSCFMISVLKTTGFIDDKIITVHTDRGLYTKYNRFFKQLFIASFKKYNVLVTTTRFNQYYWKKVAEKNEINLKYYVIGNTAGEIYEKICEKKIPNNTFLTIGFAGRMCDWKDWPLAERICGEVNKRLPDIRIMMYVSCFEKKDEKETRRMFKRMKNLLGNRFKGRINVPFEEMNTFYYNIDIYILTSWEKSESFGRTIIEAMSRKTAVLTTDAGGAVEVVNNKNNIHRDVVGFVDHIIDFEKDRGKLSIEKEKNLIRVWKKYSYKNNVESHIRMYNKLLEEIE